MSKDKINLREYFELQRNISKYLDALEKWGTDNVIITSNGSELSYEKSVKFVEDGLDALLLEYKNKYL